MDILSWTRLNPTVKQVNTKKKFFNEYLYKAVVRVPGCRVILDKQATSVGVARLLEQRIEKLLEYTKSSNYSYYARRADHLIRNAQVEQIEYWLNVKNSVTDSVKIRIEEPILSIYCNDAEQLYKLVGENYPLMFEEIHAPADAQSADILNRGEIISKNIPNYNYKILLKENKLRDVATKRNLLDYLYNLGEEVRLTKSLIRHLGTNQMWFPGGYFYAKDEKIVTFINLVAPECIAGIYKLTNPDL